MPVRTGFSESADESCDPSDDVRLPERVQKVKIRAKGHQRNIAPLGQMWDSFFIGGPAVSDDFLSERASQQQAEREILCH